MSTLRAVLVGLGLWMGTHGCLGEDAGSRYAAATNQLRQLAAAMTERCLTSVATAADWRRERPELKRQLASMLGLDPLPPRSPLRASVTGTLDRPGYRVEKVVFQSSPGLYVTGNFYVPRDISTPAPTILYLCGHSVHPHGAKTQYQDRILWFATHGYCVLALDTLEFGEVPGIHHGTHNLSLWNWLSLGYTPAGVEVWNGMRALDWLSERPEVDSQRIGVTGISGGGAISWYLAALDERVAAAAPSCSTYTYGSQAAHWLASGQCDCIYYPNTYRWDFPVVAALIAPRPLLITSGRRDPIFPPDGYHEVYQRGRRIYELLGASDHIREVDGDVGHSDPPLFLNSSREWMNRWFRGDSTPVTGTNSPAGEDPALLAVLTSPPADASNYRIHREFTTPMKPQVPDSLDAWERRKAEVLTQLRDRVFRWFPSEAIPFATHRVGGPAGWAGRYAEGRQVTFETEPGVRLYAQIFKAAAHTPAAPLVIRVKGPGENVYGSDFDEITPLLGRCHALILQPRFTETDLRASEYTDLERTAAWLGRTIAGMQVWDVLRTVEWIWSEEKLRPERIILYGRRDLGAVALYAALLDPRIHEVVLMDPPSSHWQSPALLNVLRVTDLPEVAAALAPRRITLLSAFPQESEFARTVYKLSGAEGEYRQAPSLPEAVFR
ncbi:MAG: acetylxylan esterase [Verrucomicrobiales bacterium]|nr:acetylxylan esterase [Verrucomicrobiales bacterium]